MRKLSLIVFLTALVISPGVAVAGGGSLTAFEYQQLQALQTRVKAVGRTVKTADSSTAPLKVYKELLWACEQVQMTTPLLSAQRATCDDFMQMNIFGLSVKPEVAECAANSPQAKQRMHCLGNVYRQWDQSIQAFASSNAAILTVATARELGSRCVAYLAGTSAQLGYATKLASVTKQIITAADQGNLTNFEADDGIFITDAARLQAAMNGGPQSISVCPHQ